jgi:hypothetical protein
MMYEGKKGRGGEEKLAFSQSISPPLVGVFTLQNKLCLLCVNFRAARARVN